MMVRDGDPMSIAEANSFESHLRKGSYDDE